MMKRNFILLSFICITALSTPVTTSADYSYHAEIPKDSKVSPDYLEKRKAPGSVVPDADSWQRQLDEEKARMDAETARREAEKQAKCQQQEYLSRRRADNGKYQYYTPDPCADRVGIEIPVY